MTFRVVLSSAVFGAFALLTACVQAPSPQTPTPEPSPVPQAQVAKPDKTLTPGAFDPKLTKEIICVPGYAGGARNVTESEKDKVYAEYAIASHKPGEYEVDHLISLELGGINDITNLWPQPYEQSPNDPAGAHAKDLVENWLHKQVCAGAITLQQAQADISGDWYAVYVTCCKAKHDAKVAP